MKFIQIVPVYPLTITFREDYFTWPAAMMKEKGYDCEFLTLRKKGEKKYEVINGFPLKRFSNTLSLLFYVLRQDCLLHVYLRPYSPSLFAGLLPKKKLMTPITYELGSNSFVKWLSVMLMKRFNRIIPITPYEEEIYRRHGIKKLARIPLAVDYEMYSHPAKDADVEKKFGLSGNHFTIASVSNFRHVKRIDILLRAFKEVKNSVKDSRLVLIGDDWLAQEKKPTVKQMVAELGLTDVLLTNYQPAEVISKILAYANVFANTSAIEAQCIAVYEAAASRIPLCLSNLPSFTSVFGDYALYHDTEDYVQLSKNILKYHDDSELAKKNSSYLRAFVKDWDNSEVSRKMWQAYSEVLAE
jgi:glycosyltransferase involved in cell wall biosynthesis